MGVYVNPPGISKEEWLHEKGTLLGGPLLPATNGKTMFLVCLVENSRFTAAGVCYNDKELQAFTDPTDRRPKSWYLVKSSDLMSVVTESDWERLMRERGVDGA